MEIDVYGPEPEMMAYLQGQVMALSAILSRPGLKKWDVSEIHKKCESPYEENSQLDRSFKRGLAQTLQFVSGL